MGKKLDALFGRGLKPSKLKPVINLAISRLSVFKNQRQVRCNNARSDVMQLLQLGHHDRALIRVEQVVKEQNMVDVYAIMEGYCNLLVERLDLIEQERVCPDELKEAISGLLFASSRCGDFPELQEIRAIFMSRYGKEFIARAIELRNNCGVSTKIIQKLSTKQPDLQSRRNVLNEIAAESGISLQLHEEKLDGNKNHSQPKVDILGDASDLEDGKLSDSTTKERKKYRDVADAAQAAFESAALAAAAARAAVELSRSDFHDPDDHNNTPNSQRKRVFDIHEPSPKGKETPQGSHTEESSQSKKTLEIKILSDSSSEESSQGNLEMRTMSLDEVDPMKLLEKDVVIHESDDDNYESEGYGFDMNTMKLKDKVLDDGKDDKHDEQIPSSLRAGLKVEAGPENSSEPVTQSTETKGKRPFTINKGPFSVRTRQVRGY